MELARGDVVLCVASGDYGKPRPAIVVQANLFNPTHASITVCPLTSEIVAAPLFRLDLVPTDANGLKKPSQVMIDKIVSLPRKRISSIIGRVTSQQLRAVN